MDDLNQTVSNLGFVAGEKVGPTTSWIVDNLTNIDPTTITAFQDAMIQFGFSSWIMIIYIVLRGK